MDNVAKEQITRMTLEAIARVRIALVAATQAGAEARAMAEYVRAIDNLEDALYYFRSDDDEDEDNQSSPYNPEPELSSKDFAYLQLEKAAAKQISRINISLLGK